MMAESPHFVQGEATTAQMSPAGEFSPGCMVERPATAPPDGNTVFSKTVTLSKSKPYSEIEFCIKPTASLAEDDPYMFSLHCPDGFGNDSNGIRMSLLPEGSHGQNFPRAMVLDSESDAPVAFDTEVPVYESPNPYYNPVEFRLQAGDPNDDALTYTITQYPEVGTLTGTPPNLAYTGPENWLDRYGDPFLKFKVNDGTSDSNEATVCLQINETVSVPVVQEKTPDGPAIVEVGKTLTLQVEYLRDEDAYDTYSFTYGYPYWKRTWKLDGATVKYDEGEELVLVETASWTYSPEAAALGHHTVSLEMERVPTEHKCILTSWSVTVKAPAAHEGDLNGDGIVNFDDLTLVTSNFGKSSGDPGFDAMADGNNDGVVNIEDLILVTGNFGKSY
jgi:hypothetical protein